MLRSPDGLTDCMCSEKGCGPLENVPEFHTAESAEAPYCASRATL